jgi:hypothetical protein
MATGMRPLQTAIYNKLMSAPDLLLLVSGVYDKVPEPAPYPFVSFGAIHELPDDTHDAQGLNVSVNIHVWSMAPGSSETYDIFAAVDAALDRVPLTVAGFRQVYIKQAQHQTIPDPDPRVRHLSAEYRVFMTKE